MEQIDRLEPIYLPLPDSTYATDSESQGSLEMNLNLDRVEMIYVSVHPFPYSRPVNTYFISVFNQNFFPCFALQ